MSYRAALSRAFDRLAVSLFDYADRQRLEFGRLSSDEEREREALDVGPCDGLWRHCAHKCDLPCDHDVWCADCERKYAR